MVVDTDKKRGKKREGKKRGVFFQHHSTSTGMVPWYVGTTQKRTQHQKDVTRKNTHRHSFNLARDARQERIQTFFRTGFFPRRRWSYQTLDFKAEKRKSDCTLKSD